MPLGWIQYNSNFIMHGAHPHLQLAPASDDSSNESSAGSSDAAADSKADVSLTDLSSAVFQQQYRRLDFLQQASAEDPGGHNFRGLYNKLFEHSLDSPLAPIHHLTVSGSCFCARALQIHASVLSA